MPGLHIAHDDHHHHQCPCTPHHKCPPPPSPRPSCTHLPIHSPFHPRPLMNSAVLARFEHMAEHASLVQQALLRSIVADNAPCEYLRQCGLPPPTGDDRADLTTFKHSVPLVSHSDIEPYINRIVEGEASPILTMAPFSAMSLSSGTTNARQKYIPFYDKLKTMTLELASVAAAYRDRLYPLTPGAKTLDFLFAGKYTTTKGGLKAATGTTHLIRGGVFKERSVKCMGVHPCSPDEVVVAPDCRQAMYCHLLCGLLHAKDIEVITAVFSYTLVEALRMLETEWQQLCEDIKVGVLSSKITEPSLRLAMERVLIKPNPELANLIVARIKALNDWQGLIPKLWPKCKYILSIMTGAMEQYLERLQHYAGNALPLLCADYAASEGWIAININPTAHPRDVSFTIVPNLAFFEFIPLQQQRCYGKPASCTPLIDNRSSTATYMEGEPVGLTEVKVGQDYEIVLTTRGGLYRYRLGDVVKVTGFFKSCPQFRYVCRKNVVLSINIDKNTEKDLSMVVSKAANRLAMDSRHTLRLVDYTSYADQEGPGGLGHYIIFWEVSPCTSNSYSAKLKGPKTHQQVVNDAPDDQMDIKTVREEHHYEVSTLLAECATLMDRAFVEPGYLTSRKMGTIGPLELRVVKPGTFSKMLDCYLAKGPAITQYKTPRCIFSRDHLAILRACTSSTYFSSS